MQRPLSTFQVNVFESIRPPAPQALGFSFPLRCDTYVLAFCFLAICVEETGGGGPWPPRGWGEIAFSSDDEHEGAGKRDRAGNGKACSQAQG